MNGSKLHLRIIAADGRVFDLSATTGESVMDVAVRHDVPGIVGECGGNLSCATCHVMVEPVWLPVLDGPNATERQMLECVVEPKSNSRLGCCIPMHETLDGLVVYLPESQF